MDKHKRKHVYLVSLLVNQKFYRKENALSHNNIDCEIVQKLLKALKDYNYDSKQITHIQLFFDDLYDKSVFCLFLIHSIQDSDHRW